MGKEAERLLGLHFLLDGLARDGASLGSSDGCRVALLTLPDRLGLTRVADPQVVVTADGWVGMVLLAESHLSLHVRPQQRLLHADLFSCRRFDRAEAERWLVERFDLVQVSARSLER